MRHRKAGVKLNRTASHRKAMFRNMVTSLFKYERIKTTNAKAKELRGWADHLITLAKRGDLHARRQALAIIREKEVVHKLFDEAPKKYASVQGGYTRVVKIGRRPGDQALMSIIELVTPEKPKKKKAPKKKAKATAKKTAAKKQPKSAAKAKDAKQDDAATDEGVAKEAKTEAKAAPEEATVKDATPSESKQADADASEGKDGEAKADAKAAPAKKAKPAKKKAAKKSAKKAAKKAAPAQSEEAED